MDNNANQVMKKMLQKITDSIVSNRKYSSFDKVEIFFAFGSKHRTAMCDWVYGLKIYVKEGTDTVIVGERIKERITRVMSQISNDTFCLTDINFL